MKRLNKDEIYSNLKSFLDSKGIELKEGSYVKRIEQSCGMLTEAINLGQKGIEKAKTKVDENLERMRQVIHEKTAPKAPATPATPPPSAANAAPPAADPKKGASKLRKPAKASGGGKKKGRA